MVRRVEKIGRIESEKKRRKKKIFPSFVFSIDNGKYIYIFFIWLRKKSEIMKKIVYLDLLLSIIH